MENEDIEILGGLSQLEADEILAREGFNELPSAKPRSIFAITWSVIREPMFLLLVAGGVIYLLLGDLKEALMLMGFVFVIIGITLYQERKTENALLALRNLSSPRARVLRDGRDKRIPGREVVRGDIVIIVEGDRVPADGVALTSTNLLVDESVLTGESVSVRKVSWDGESAPTQPGGDDQPFVYSGTLVVQGQGLIQVQNTGVYTEIGKIGTTLESLGTEKTILEKQTARLVRNLAISGAGLSILVIVAYGITRGNWLQGFLTGITLAMAILPEEFTVVLTVFLALGAWRISRKRVLTRRTAAVETLGATTVLCVDKTGTLTLNRMTVRELYSNGRSYDAETSRDTSLPEEFHALVEFGILSSQRDPFDPMESAIKEFGNTSLARTEHLHGDWSLVREYPLSRQLLAVSHVWRSPSGVKYVIAAKGAPEAIADLCHFSTAQMRILSSQIVAMGEKGLRVIGVARAYFEESAILPGEQHEFEFQFLGLVGLIDPVRPGVPGAIRECYDAGIRVIMITGDYPSTARSIARDIGLKRPDAIMTGVELDAINDVELSEHIEHVEVFARAVPEQKLRIVKALKANGEVVAMTGDGVNDAPALKAADIGIAMGARGTDVARESAGIVLLDDDFSSIVVAIRLGRRIFDNLRKAMAYIIAIHVPIAGLSLIPVPFGLPLILMPVHILFLQLIIDPACSIVFEAEPEETDIMSRSPRDPLEPIFNRRALSVSVLQGSIVLLIALSIFVIVMRSGHGADKARAMTYTTLIVANLVLILTNRSWSRTIPAALATRNRALWWVLGGAATFLVMILFIPFLRGIFGFSILSLREIGICLIAGSLNIVWFEVLKAILSRSHRGLLANREDRA